MNFAADARRIGALAWPVFAGQIAVLAFSTVDTVLVARYAATDLAALAVGAATYATVFVGLMGVALAVGPIAGQFYGAQQYRECGRQLHQAMWLAIALSVLGCAALLHPEPFLRFARAEAAVADRIRAYLHLLAIALPAALLFTAFRGFNTAVSRPKAVMALQLGGLALKVPLSAAFIYGYTLPLPWGEFHQAPLGLPGGGLATAIVMWAQLFCAFMLLRRDPFYARFGLQRLRIDAPDRAALKTLLRLGLPMGLSIIIEVTGFTFMAFFISRLGAGPVAGHQIAANLVALMFMLPLALANATSTLVAQHVGGAMLHDARRIGWHGLQIGAGCGVVLGAAVFLGRDAIVHAYTRDPLVVAAALPLLAWAGLFHAFDATQALASFVLRAYRIATVPLVIYAVSLWGVGLGGGCILAFDVTGHTPDALRGAPGFWFAATAGLALAATGLAVFLARTLRREAAV